MNELSEAVDTVNADKQLVAEEANYQSVTDQIKAGEDAIGASREAIRQHQEHIRLTVSDIRRLKARRRVFAMAKFKLQQINEDFVL